MNMPTVEPAVVVVTGATENETKVYHRDFPEIRGDGKTPHEAACRLEDQFTNALDTALTDWRRETLNKAMADVKAFVASSE
jgi:hypothetical protein